MTKTPNALMSVRSFRSQPQFEKGTRSFLAKPTQRRVPVREPFGWKHGWPFRCLFAHVGEVGWHEEGEPPNARRPIARDDVGIAPLHHAWPETVAELERVDE